MAHHLYTLLCLLVESLAARRDAQVRFLKEENRILRSRIPGQRLVLAPEERCRLLAIGRELGHHVKGLVGVVQYRTYRRWVKEQEAGRKPGRVGRPRTIGRSVRTWRGTPHEVAVLEGGKRFEYRGEVYRSLSQVAAIITGAHWSGPRFFGLHRVKR